jgi:hypothetical protein
VATAAGGCEIPRVSQHAPAPLPPYGLPTPVFRHRALAALAARAPIGPERDVALAWFLCARLLDGAGGAAPLSPAVRASRAAAARTWLASAGLPAACRVPLGRVMDACGTEGDPDRARLAKALAEALRVTGSHLDAAARDEIETLARG